MKKQMTSSCLLLLCILQPVGSNGQPTGNTSTESVTETAALQSITEAEMRDHIYFLASDFLKGRVGPSPEYEIAAQYVASQFAQAGLQPVASELDCMDGFFQEVPFERGVYGDGIKWVISSGTGEMEFDHLEDFKVLENGFIPAEPLEVVFVGYGISEPALGWDDLENIDIRDKMVVGMTDAPTKKGKPVLPEPVHAEYSGMKGLQKKAFPIIDKRPAAIVLVPDSEMASMIPFQMIPSNFKEINYTYQGAMNEDGEFRMPMVYLVRDTLLDALFRGQKTSPADIEEKGLKKYETCALAKLQVETQFPLKEKSRVSLKNVVGMVSGTDPELSNEFIVVGAHLDHVAIPGGEVHNGADDNASGSAGVMEIAEAVAMSPPRRSVVFVTYTAEEMGLHGSHYFVHSGLCPIDAMKFNVNLDMIGRTTRENMETGGHYLVAKKTYMPQIRSFIDEINASGLNVPLLYDTRHSGSSDHANFNRAGIPAFFFFSGMHEDLHMPGDDPEKIEYDKAVRLSRLSYQVTMKLANMDIVPDFTAEAED